MLPVWSTFADAARLALESQQVIALRLTRIALGGPLAVAETHRMVTEKVAAFALANQAAALALMAGKPPSTAATHALLPIRRRLRANRRRLSRR